MLGVRFVDGRRIADVIINLWKEAEWVMTSIEYKMKEVVRMMRIVDKKRIFGLQLEVGGMKEEMDTLKKFREKFLKMILWD